MRNWLKNYYKKIIGVFMIYCFAVTLIILHSDYPVIRILEISLYVVFSIMYIIAAMVLIIVG